MPDAVKRALEPRKPVPVAEEEKSATATPTSTTPATSAAPSPAPDAAKDDKKEDAEKEPEDAKVCVLVLEPKICIY